MYDTMFHGRALVDGRIREIYICVEGGVIERISYTRPSSGDIGELHSFGRSLMIPGVLDTHVHMRDPGLTRKEDLRTGSISAAFGGVTTFIDMPNTIPPTSGENAFLEKVRTASSRSVVDFAFNICIMSDSDIQRTASLFDLEGPRPAGMKAFMGESTGSLVFGPFESLGPWGKMMERTGAPLSVHAEDGALFGKGPLGRDTILKDHNEMRPPVSEASAIERISSSIHPYEGRVHLLHVSSEMGMEAARASRCTIEVTPHHLLLDTKTAGDRLEHPSFGKVNPPIRNTADRAALWKAVSDGTVLTVGSDHAPHLPEEKIDTFPPPSGMPGTETMLPLMLEMVSRKKLTMRRCIELLCSNPAERFGIWDRGDIVVGKKADIVVVDMDDHRRIMPEDLHSRCGWTAYEGMNGIFPTNVFSRGEPIIDTGDLCVKGGRGINVL